MIRRTAATAFDDLLFCDWSASSRPKRGKDSVWIGHGSFDARGQLNVGAVNHPTRHDAIAKVHALLNAAVAEKRRVLVGFDFPYGLPFDGYAHLLHAGADWRDYWAELAGRIRDDGRNINNRFDVASALNQSAGARPGPFWGVPPARATPYLQKTKPVPRFVSPAEFRQVEAVLRSRRRSPFSVWQLLGNGSVGSQALLGLPYLWSLIDDAHLKPCSVVWPFDARWESKDRPLIVHAEVWPGVIDVDLGRHPVRDAAQMIALVEWAAQRDVGGHLLGDLRAYQSSPLTKQRARVEGWILGVT